MKYYETPKHKKSGKKTVLYIAAAGCVIAIGAAVWMAAARNSSPGTVPRQSEQQSEPIQDSSVGESSVPQITPSEPEPVSEPTEKPVEDAPYEEPQQAMIMPVDGELIKDFSDTALQFSATYNDLRLHSAIDIGCENGTAVKAAGAGEVKAVEQSAALGGFVTVAHDNGVVFKYCGLDHISVSVGQKLKMGDPIGAVGTVPGECADKEHLHLEAVRDNKPISPLEVIGVLD